MCVHIEAGEMPNTEVKETTWDNTAAADPRLCDCVKGVCFLEAILIKCNLLSVASTATENVNCLDREGNMPLRLQCRGRTVRPTYTF